MFVDFNILNQLGSPAINSNTFANRPAAGQTGRLFVSTDTFELYRDNGTGWDLIGGPGSSTVTGSGAAGQVTYWTGASTIGGNNNLFWDNANSRLGIGTTTPGHKLQINGTGTLLSLNGGSDTYMLFAGNGADQYQIGYTDNAADYRRFSIYDSTGAKEVLTIDKQSRYVGINYQYSSLADQPAYTLDVSGSTRATDSSFFVTSGTGQVGINTTSPTATALVQANKTDGYGLYLNYTTSTGSGSTATALWALNTTAGSGFAAVIEEKTANTTGGQYPLLIKHSLSSGTAAAGMGTGLHFQLPDSTGTFKTTQLTVETTDAAAATYTTRYRFMAQVNGTSTALAYLTSVGLGIGNVIPSYKLDVNGTVRAFGVGNTGNFLAVDTNPGGATVNLNPQYGTGLPILYTNGAFPLLFGTNNTENMRLTTAGFLGLGTSNPSYLFQVEGGSGYFNLNASGTSVPLYINNSSTAAGTQVAKIAFASSGAIKSSISAAVFGNDYMTFNVGSDTERARFTSGGNFLIGTTTDNGSRLQVNGGITATGETIRSGGILYLNNTDNSQAAYLVSTGTSGNAPLFFATNSALKMRLDASGNMVLNTDWSSGFTDFGRLVVNTNTIGANAVGINVTAIANATSTIFRLGSAGDTGLAGVEIRAISDYTTTGATQMTFTTANSSGVLSEKMRITSAGLVGIGTSTPAANLHVYGGSSGNTLPGNAQGIFEFNANGGIAISTPTGNASGVYFPYSTLSYYAGIDRNVTDLRIRNGNADRIIVTTGGNVLVNTSVDNGDKFQVNGNLNVNNGSFYATTSASKVSIGTTNQIGQLDVTNSTGAKSINNTKQKGTSDATFNLLTLSNANTNFGVGIYGRIVAVSPISNDAVIIEFWAAANRTGGGATTYTALTPVISKTIVGSSINAGTLAWSGATLQYTTSTLVNYTYFNFEIQAGMGDSGTITFN